MQIVMTKTICENVEKNPQFLIEILESLERFNKCDWGDLCDEDKALNDLAVKTKDRTLASYITSQGKVYIITDAGHEITTVLFANEY